MNEAILLVEDDTNVLTRNQNVFEREGYVVLSAETLAEARERLEEGIPDLVVLDVVMPDGSGLDFCKEIRSRVSIPILFLTIKRESDHIVNGLYMGANDYIVKPYETQELLARVKSQLAHQERMRETLRGDVEFGGLLLDMASRRAVYGGADIVLPPKEFSLLEALMRRAGQYIGAYELYQSIWGMDANEDIRTLFVRVSTMRRKLRDGGAGHLRIDRDLDRGLRLRVGAPDEGERV